MHASIDYASDQQVAQLRAGWADGSVQPYEYTDIDRTIAGGVSIAAKQ